ncbi:MAG TPA: class I SAM-dependent methyltransferase [Stellaceae bacterium]|nr:class I SAM-dependent methyltransferase [Stellaceae bacterium]
MRLREDIGDHLSTLFSETLVMRPRLIVELGVRQGASRFALEQAARLCGSALVSSDLDDCSAVCSQSPRWYFVKQDDIAFAGEFPEWCAARNIAPGIDVLFIDTSHLYEHTVQEIRAWFPLLSSCCKVIFHDTNLRKYFRRLDGTIGGGWDNERGVIRAIEERLDTKFNERIDFVTTVDEWTIRHWAHCNGLTVLERDHGFSRLSTPRS